jgi:hypothetical protein
LPDSTYQESTMNVPPPAATAAPLHLYDHTHGQRRITLWRESDASGTVYVVITLAVPVVTQAPGEAPQTEWVRVAHASDEEPLLCYPTADRPHYGSIALNHVSFDLLGDEVDAIAEYLGLDAIDGEQA